MPDEKVKPIDIQEALGALSTLCYFPREASGSVARDLAKMMPHRRALQWTVDAVLNSVSDWPGLKEIRGVLCSRFDPADGIDAWSSIAGFTAEDGEQKYLEAHEERKNGAIASSSLKLLAGIGKGMK